MVWLTKPPLGTQLDWTHPLNNGLVGFWVFNEGSGDIVNDLSGNEYTGTLTDIAFPPTPISGWNPGRLGPAIAFDGSNDYITIGSLANCNGRGTLATWIKASTWATCGIVAKGATAVSYAISYGLWGYVTGKPKLIVSNGAVADIIEYNTVLSTNVWYHLVGTWDGTNLTVFLNGVQDNQESQDVTQVSNTRNLIFGTGVTNGYPFNGMIDEVRVWNRALTTNEVMLLYTSSYEMFLEGCPPLTCSLNVS